MTGPTHKMHLETFWQKHRAAQPYNGLTFSINISIAYTLSANREGERDAVQPLLAFLLSGEMPKNVMAQPRVPLSIH